MPEDIITNGSKDSDIPEPPADHMCKKVQPVQHDNTVTWLASWTENIQNQIKYIMPNPSSKLKGEKDWQKARKLKDKIDKIRDAYMQDLKREEIMVGQRALALYFIDKLALRPGKEWDKETADKVGCCSLRYEHINHQKDPQAMKGA